MTVSSVAPILVVACGNVLCGDDALGPTVVERLRSTEPRGVDLVRLAAGPTELIDHLPGRSVLIVVDGALIPDRPAGELLICEWDSPDRPKLLTDVRLSTHGISLAQQIELARQLEMLPRVVMLVAVTIESADPGMDMTEPVRRSVDQVVQAILELFRDSNTILPP
jgi:hydrogenase maturation protease